MGIKFREDFYLRVFNFATFPQSRKTRNWRPATLYISVNEVVLFKSVMRTHVYFKRLESTTNSVGFDSREKDSSHRCETWQAGSFPRLHSFDELFNFNNNLFIYLFIYLYSAHILSSWRLKPQSRDSPSPCNGPKCLTENGEYLVNLYSPYFIVFLWLLVRALECPFEPCPCAYIGNRQLSKTGYVT